MMPSIFRENLFDDFMDGFTFPAFSDIDKALYGKHARNLMKTDVKETDTGYEVDIDLPGFKKEEVNASLENGYLTIRAAKGWIKMRRIKRPAHISVKNVIPDLASVPSMLEMISLKTTSKVPLSMES